MDITKPISKKYKNDTASITTTNIVIDLEIEDTNDVIFPSVIGSNIALVNFKHKDNIAIWTTGTIIHAKIKIRPLAPTAFFTNTLLAIIKLNPSAWISITLLSVKGISLSKTTKSTRKRRSTKESIEMEITENVSEITNF